MKPKSARNLGVMMNHKLTAAQWLGERGWGRPKPEADDRVVNISVVNYADAPTQPAPVRQATVEEDKQIANAEGDAGRDQLEYLSPLPNGPIEKLPEIEDFDLGADR